MGRGVFGIVCIAVAAMLFQLGHPIAIFAGLAVGVVGGASLITPRR